MLSILCIYMRVVFVYKYYKIVPLHIHTYIQKCQLSNAYIQSENDTGEKFDDIKPV